MRDPIKCIDCPTIIKDPWPNQVRCNSCAEAHNKKYRMELYYQKKEQEKVIKHEAHPVEKVSVKKGPAFVSAPAWYLKGKSADQIMIEARALGLSDGKYEALVSCGMIERYCEGLGVDGLKVIDRAWKDFLKQREERRKQLESAIKAGSKSTAGTAPRT